MPTHHPPVLILAITMGNTSKLATTAAAVLVAILTILSFAGAFSNGFVNWDDQVYVLENPHIKNITFGNTVWIFTHSYFRSYVPFTLLSHALDYQLWGEDPAGHHATSIGLHAANAVLFFLLILALLRQMRTGEGDVEKLPGAHIPTLFAAAASSLMFALHPLRVESVAWVADRKDLLCAFFLLPSYIAYLKFSSLRGNSKASSWYRASLFLFLLALLSKPSAMTAPVVLLLLDIFLLHPETWRNKIRRLLLEKVPFAALALAAGLAALLQMPDTSTSTHMNTAEKLLLPFYSLVMNIGKFLWPAHLAPVYDKGSIAAMLASMVVIVLITGACILLARLGRRRWLAAWLYFIIVSIPTTAFHSGGIQPIADRYTYLTMLSFCVVAGMSLASGLARGGGGCGAESTAAGFRCGKYRRSDSPRISQQESDPCVENIGVALAAGDRRFTRHRGFLQQPWKCHNIRGPF